MLTSIAMHHLTIPTELERNADVFRALLSGLSPEQFTWKPAPDKWCLLEVVCHLYDEEREDFRARIKHTLSTPGEPMPPIDPQGWVSSRSYMQQEYQQRLEDLLCERAASVQWLRSLDAPDWELSHAHPKLGQLSAGLFLHNWLAHDYLHLRQINRLKYEYLAANTTVNLNYAGDW